MPANTHLYELSKKEYCDLKNGQYENYGKGWLFQVLTKLLEVDPVRIKTRNVEKINELNAKGKRFLAEFIVDVIDQRGGFDSDQ